jgi:hypothetical protein
MKRVIFVLALVVFAFGYTYASDPLFGSFYKGLIANDVSVIKGIDNAGLGLLQNPFDVAYARNFEFNVSIGILPYDRFLAYGNASLSLERITGVSFLGGIGLSVVYSGINGIELFDENASSLGTYSSSSFGFLASLGSSLSEFVGIPFDWGLNVKYSSDSMYNISGSGLGVDLGVAFSPVSTLKDLGFKVNLLDVYSSKTWNTGTSEMVPLTLNVGAFYSLFDDSLLISLDFFNSGRYNEVFMFKDVGASLGAVYVPTLNLIIRGGVKVSSEVVVFVGVSYRLDFGKVDYVGSFDGLGFNNFGSLSFNVGAPKFVAKSISPEVAKKKEEENLKARENEAFAKAMVYFANKDYKNAKVELENVLKVNPNNNTAKAMLQKIEEILSLEE